MKLRSGVLNEENVIKKNFEANKTIKKKEKVKINSKSKNSGKVDKSVAAPSKNDWQPPNYKDKAWLQKELHRCQVCSKDFKTHVAAVSCVVAHQRVRCYLCFGTFTCIDKLFLHFGEKHVKIGDGSTGGTLNCVFCKIEIPYKSVSCHVISNHLEHKVVAKENDVDDKVKPPIKNEWQAPNYKDKEWFHKETKRCQVCSKEFPDPAKASACVMVHKMLRCFFCFWTFASTDTLFEHLKLNHGEKNGTLNCVYCEQEIPLKSVSCHVISKHIL